MSAARWESCAFALPTDPRDPNRRHVWGIAWGVWGIAGGRGAWTIFHRASGKRLTTFTALGKSRRDNFAARPIAKEFCFQIDGLADWSTASAHTDPPVPLRLHAIALRLTSGRPELRIVASAALDEGEP